MVGCKQRGLLETSYRPGSSTLDPHDVLMRCLNASRLRILFPQVSRYLAIPRPGQSATAKIRRLRIPYVGNRCQNRLARWVYQRCLYLAASGRDLYITNTKCLALGKVGYRCPWQARSAVYAAQRTCQQTGLRAQTHPHSRSRWGASLTARQAAAGRSPPPARAWKGPSSSRRLQRHG